MPKTEFRHNKKNSSDSVLRLRNEIVIGIFIPLSDLENKKRRETIRCLFLYLVPPSNHARKQARTVHAPSGVNLLNCLLPRANFGGFDIGETRAESSSI